MKGHVRAIGAAALVALLATPVSADTISYADAMQELIGACSKDVQKYCADVRLGSGRIEDCLAKNGSKVSAQCTTTFATVQMQIAARAAAQAAVPDMCAADANRLCSNFRGGKARILNCLIRRDNVRRVSKRCNQAINDAGWR